MPRGAFPLARVALATVLLGWRCGGWMALEGRSQAKGGAWWNACVYYGEPGCRGAILLRGDRPSGTQRGCRSGLMSDCTFVGSAESSIVLCQFVGPRYCLSDVWSMPHAPARPSRARELRPRSVIGAARGGDVAGLRGAAVSGGCDTAVPVATCTTRDTARTRCVNGIGTWVPCSETESPRPSEH